MFLGFGEVMARVAPEAHRRWRQALPGRVEITWGGGEANVCASLAFLGNRARFLTALPDHAVARAMETTLRGLGVDTDHILWRSSGRMGVYFVEQGANQRGSTVLYDREGSAVSLAGPDEYDFAGALDGVQHVHVTGITPAISEAAFLATRALVQQARELQIAVSCDLNFRKKLWNWKPGTDRRRLARESMAQILPYVDLVIGNEGDASDVLDIHAEGTDVEAGRIQAEAYRDVARQIVAQYGNVRRVAITLRQSVSADFNYWGGMLYDAASDEAFFAPMDDESQYAPYAIRDIVDRVGAGDSFAAGLLHALASEQHAAPADAIRFAVAASCLKHSIWGDFNYTSEAEVLALAAGNVTGRVQR